MLSSHFATTPVAATAAVFSPLLAAARSASFTVRQRDTAFVLNEVWNISEHYKKLGNSDLNEELLDSIVSSCSTFAQDVLHPLDSTGDAEGCKLTKDNNVITPKGFKEAYTEYIAGGWQSMSVPPKYGGQGLLLHTHKHTHTHTTHMHTCTCTGLPLSAGLIKAEIIGTANWSFGMYPGLSIGAMNTLLLHASEQQKQTYLTKLSEGTWSGTMCLTEPQCGTDLSQVC